MVQNESFNTPMNIDHRPIDIQVRDINGNRNQYHYSNRSALMADTSFVNSIDEETEILCVFVGDTCIYNELTGNHPITAEDIIGYFA